MLDEGEATRGFQKMQGEEGRRVELYLSAWVMEDGTWKGVRKGSNEGDMKRCVRQ